MLQEDRKKKEYEVGFLAVMFQQYAEGLAVSDAL